ncbi:MAG: ABC transporter permease, partial [Actinomycetes bacterium]
MTGAAPALANEVVVDAATAARVGVDVGSVVGIAAAGASVPYRVTGIAAAPVVLREGAVFVSDEQARTLGEPVAIAVFGDPDVPTGASTDLVGLVRSLLGGPDTLVDRVEAALSAAGLGDRAVVRADVGRGEVEFLSAAQSRFVLLLVSGSFTGFVLMIVVIVVAGTLSLLVHQRRREIALLRAVAATPRQVHRMLAAEVLLVAGAAALIGVGPGYLVAAALRDGFARIGVIVDGFALSTSPAPAVAAILLCLGAARVAVWAAARRAVRVPPVEGLRESAVERSGIGRVRVVAGRIVLVLACVSVVATVAVPARLATVPAAMASMLAVIGVALLGPRLMGHLSRLAGARLLRSPL